MNWKQATGAKNRSRRIGFILVSILGLAVIGAFWGVRVGETAPAVGELNPIDSRKLKPARPDAVVKIRFAAEPATLNPWLESSSYGQFIADYVYETLLEQDLQTFQWHGRLAESWDEEIVSTDSEEPKLEFTFHLKAGARFHDGHLVTADDVVFSVNAIRNQELNSPYGSYYADIESCRAPDDRTVEVVYSHPYWMAKKHLGELHILPRHYYDPENLSATDPKAFAASVKMNSSEQLPLGSGPYRVSAWHRGAELVLERSPVPGRGDDRPPDRIVFRFITDHVAALQALKNGEIDFIPRLDGELFDAEQQKPGFKARFQSSVYYTEYFDFVAWNLERPYFREKKVRQALAFAALDRQQFLQTMLHGRGKIITGSQYYFGPAYDHDVLPRSYDPRKAKMLLAQAGWIDHNGDGTRDKDGVEFRFELSLRSGNKLARQRAAVMQQALSSLQIGMEIREMEMGAFVQHVIGRHYDACTLGWVVESESDPFQLWHSSQIGRSGSNLPGLSLPEVDELIERSRTTLDAQKRRGLFYRLHSILYDEQPYLFLYCRPNLAVYSRKLQNVRFYPVRPGYRIQEWRLLD